MATFWSLALNGGKITRNGKTYTKSTAPIIMKGFQMLRPATKVLILTSYRDYTNRYAHTGDIKNLGGSMTFAEHL